MADINLEIQPSTKVKISKVDPKNSLSLTLQNPTSGSATKVRFHIPADGEKVKPSSSDEENPSEGGPKSGPPPTDQPKPKAKKSHLALILKIIAAMVIIVGVANFFLWVVVNPRKMKFYVTNAELAEFTLSEDNTLQYNLRLNFTVRNPNKRIEFRYESIVVGAYYEGAKFDSGNLLTFHHQPKSTAVLDTWLAGARMLLLYQDEVQEFEQHKSSGVYPIDVKIRVYSSIKLGKLHMGDFKVKVKCGLKVPILSAQNYGGDWKFSAASSFSGFKATQCHVDFNPLIVNYRD